MQARVVVVRDITDRDRAAWQELAASAVEPNPFAEAAAVEPAARLLERGDDAALLVVESGGRLHFALPLLRTRGFRRIPVPAIGTWMHDYMFLGTPLLSPERPEAAWAAALGLLRTSGGAPWAVLDLLPTDGPSHHALASAVHATGVGGTWFEPRSRAVVVRRDEDTYLDGRVSSRRLKTWRRLRRRLGEELGTEPVTVDRAGHGDAVEAFLRMEASGWKGQDGGAFSCRPAHAQYFRDLCRGFAADGRLQLWTLGSAELPVAALCALVAGDTVFHMKIAYDDAYARFSPGTQLELDMLPAFHDDSRLRVLDSCTAATDTVSDLLYPDRRPLATLLLPLRGPVGAAAAKATPHLASAYRRLRRRQVA